MRFLEHGSLEADSKINLYSLGLRRLSLTRIPWVSFLMQYAVTGG